MTIAAWPPTRYTPPLSADFPSVFARYERVLDLIWTGAFGYTLDAWQRALLRAVTEIDPATGRLRWSQVVVSLGRQNGKSEVITALAILRMLTRPADMVVGIADGIAQANLIYERARKAITASPDLAALFPRASGTRGIHSAAGGSYTVRPAKSAALQGIPVALGIADELHLLKREVWADLVNGTGGRPDTLVVGITTAGTSASELLTDLYRVGAESIETGGESGVFFAVWEAPEARVPEDDDTLAEWLAMANPAVACGRRDVKALVRNARTMPPEAVVQFLLNRFLSSTRSPFMQLSMWQGLAGGEFPHDRAPVFAFDATPGLSFASVVAVAKDDEGDTHVRLVASLRNPTFDHLVALAVRLAEWSPRAMAFERYTLGAVSADLRKRGYNNVVNGTLADAVNGAALVYRLASTETLQHGGEPLFAQQVAHAVKKKQGDGFRISRPDSAVEIDAISAVALGTITEASTPETPAVQVF